MGRSKVGNDGAGHGVGVAARPPVAPVVLAAFEPSSLIHELGEEDVSVLPQARQGARLFTTGKTAAHAYSSGDTGKGSYSSGKAAYSSGKLPADCVDEWVADCPHLIDHCATSSAMKLKCRKTCGCPTSHFT